MKIRRNDPCLCGSGKKYKRCCLDKMIRDGRILKDKMSAVLIDFAEPLFEFTADRDIVCQIAMIAWNLAIIAKSERGQMLEEAIKELSGEDYKVEVDFRTLLTVMIQRKIMLYPNNKRLMLNYSISGQKENAKLHVASVQSAD